MICVDVLCILNTAGRGKKGEMMMCTLLHLNTFRARVIKIALDREDLWDVLSLFLIHLLVYVGFLCHSYTDLSLFFSFGLSREFVWCILVLQ